MPGPPILVTRRLPSSVNATLTAVFDADLNPHSAALPREELLARVAGKHGLICSVTDRVDAELLDAGATLQVVANVGVGYDNIDLAAARERGVVVTNTPDVLTEATAELTWALILGIMRRVAEGDRVIRRGAWMGFALDFLLGAQLSGKQLGIVGAGRIGMAVARRAAAFDMRVAVVARPEPSNRETPEPRNRTEEPRNRETQEPRSGVPIELSFDELLVSSDVISLHVPLSDRTRHLIDWRALARMKRTAFLVNTSRGAVVDEDALVWALSEGLIAGAALDVFIREPHVPPALFAFENVLLTPHLGSATRETRTAMASLAARNVIAVLSGQPPITPISA